jgi:hypothetical protein
VGFIDHLARLRTRLETPSVSLFEDVNTVLDLNVGGKHMPEEKLSQDELDRQRAEQLPDREVMSTLNPVGHPLPPVSGDEEFLFPTDPTPKGPIGGTP